jgi:hypothetical protein
MAYLAPKLYEGGIVFGLVLGFFQWLVLRPRVRFAGWWIVVSAGIGAPIYEIGLANAFKDVPFIAVNSMIASLQQGPRGILMVAVTLPTVVGVGTGLVMEWLLRRPKTVEEQA